MLCKTHKRFINKRKLASFIGYLQSCSLAIPSARLHLVQLYTDLNKLPGWHSTASIRISHKSLKEIK